MVRPSNTPNSRSRRRSSRIGRLGPAGEPARLADRLGGLLGADVGRGEQITSGRSCSGSAANQRPVASAWLWPRSLSGTSTSRRSRSMTLRPASCAASRATLPWLCPWRTSHRRLGQCWVLDQCVLLSSGQSMSASIGSPLVDAKRCPSERAADERVHMATTIEELEARRAAAQLGGGEKRIAAQHAKGRLTARERLSRAARPRIVRGSRHVCRA